MERSPIFSKRVKPKAFTGKKTACSSSLDLFGTSGSMDLSRRYGLRRMVGHFLHLHALRPRAHLNKTP